MIPVAADAEQALAMIRSHPDGTVVDVRDEEEYITGHLADAVLLPVDEISAETAAEALPNQSSPVLVYCKTGKRSRAAAEKLAALHDPIHAVSSAFCLFSASDFTAALARCQLPNAPARSSRTRSRTLSSVRSSTRSSPVPLRPRRMSAAISLSSTVR